MFHWMKKTEATNKVSVDTVLVIAGGVGSAIAAGITAYFQLRKSA